MSRCRAGTRLTGLGTGSLGLATDELVLVILLLEHEKGRKVVPAGVLKSVFEQLDQDVNSISKIYQRGDPNVSRYGSTRKSAYGLTERGLKLAERLTTTRWRILIGPKIDIYRMTSMAYPTSKKFNSGKKSVTN